MNNDEWKWEYSHYPETVVEVHAAAIYGPFGGLVEFCTNCGAGKAKGMPCHACVPEGKVKCPASLDMGAATHKASCPLCKGSGLVDELVG